jgi:2-keto-3-deoxy-L-rhamnonate aldolase RhmA
MGFDFALVDMEHTPASFETVTEMTRAVDAADGDTATVARVPWNDPVAIKRVLDVGVQGVMVPMVESGEEAAEFVAATRYPPEGVRGVAAARAADYGLDFEGYVERANEELVTIAQVETRAGLENVADIAAVEGLDALFLGPADLSTALGVFGEYDDETFLDAVDSVLTAAHDEGVPVATLATSDEQIETWVDLGFDFLMAGTDATYVLAGAGRARATAESAFEGRETRTE